ncbi:MAG: O-antigen ligase [Parcubacteria group bacterium]|jgi:O-antigen ligase
MIIPIFLLWIFDGKKKIRELAAEYRNYTLGVSLIILGLLLSVLINKDYYIGFGAVKGWFLFPIIFSIILNDYLGRDEKILKKIFLSLFLSAVFISMAGIYYKIAGLLSYDGRLHLFYDSPNQLAMFLAPGLIIGALFFLEKKSKYSRTGFGIGLALVGLNIFFTYSFGAWIAIALAFTVFSGLKYIKFRQGIIIFSIIAFLAVAGFLNQKEKFRSAFFPNERSSLASRIMIWKSAGRMIEDNPLFGIGPGNFQEKYLEYQKYFPPYLEWAVPQPHNLFFAFWLEAGLIGLVGFAALIYRFFRDNKKAISNNRLFGTMCFGIILYYLIHGFIDTTYWRNDMAFVFWTVVAINIYLANPSRTRMTDAELKSGDKKQKPYL